MTPLRVLVIEDDEDDFIITRDFFADISGQPYELTWASSYQAGLEAIPKQEFDALLIDYRLGPHNGLEFLQQAKQSGCQAPMILLTGLGDYQVDVQAMQAGAADYLIKGQMSPALLERSIRHALQRKNIEQKLRESEEQYRLLFEKNPHPMWVADHQTLAFYAVNEAAIRHYGFSKAEFLKMTMHELKPLEDGQSTAAITPLSPGTSDAQFGLKGIWRHRLKSGGLIDVELTSNWISFQGKPAALILAHDISQRATLEAQLRQAQKMEALGTLAGGIAHDFNNILCIILANACCLPEYRTDPEEFQERLQSIEHAIERGTSLVKQILTFARRSGVVLQPVNVNAIIEELVNLLSGTLPKTLTIRLQLQKDLPSITADPNQLHQSLLNLCVNARDAMPQGGALSISTSVVPGHQLRDAFPESQDHDYVRVSVGDTGVGMDDLTRSHIFEPFFTTKSRDRGTGLGLAVVYGVIKSHQGFIQVQSALGRGTTFHLHLPAPNQKQISAERRPAEAQETPGGTETILLVEDEELLLDLIRRLLLKKGYQVLTAKDGVEALEIYEQRQPEIALVILDMGLPRLGGWEAFLRMKEMNPDIRAVLASGYLDPNLKTNIMEAGAKDFIQKPYIPNELFRRVRRALDSTS